MAILTTRATHERSGAVAVVPIAGRVRALPAECRILQQRVASVGSSRL